MGCGSHFDTSSSQGIAVHHLERLGGSFCCFKFNKSRKKRMSVKRPTTKNVAPCIPTQSHDVCLFLDWAEGGRGGKWGNIKEVVIEGERIVLRADRSVQDHTWRNRG